MHGDGLSSWVMILGAADNNLLGLSTVQWALFIAGVGLIFALRRWRYVQKQKRQKETAKEVEPAHAGGKEGAGNVKNMRDVGVQIQAILADVEETARRAAAQVNNRYEKLEILLGEADARIKRLEELSGSGEPANEYSHGQPRGSGEQGASEPVYQMADGGMSVRDIAQKLGKQPGEVELILALRTSGKR